ncbi:DUF4435 domain-containing protein [Cobetia amphilecti]|uniref:DUF4435 domain-containing protein n=1 Tax=Cobetia amphilecti TaxID=1055104 RepID=UPI001C08E18D|nr:DUF4435 domain-containing protein [Cobetia amphilecti]MBU3008359.1 DUF4435 domain-containing protein [Cobetia amphilecti]
MREFLNEDDKIVEIRMLFSHDLYADSCMIVVEGNADIKLFRKIFDIYRVKLEPMDGKKPLMRVMNAISQEFPNKIIGICDADFDRLFNNHLDYQGYSVYATDWHDAEIMMLNSEAMNSFIDEYSKQEYWQAARNDLYCEVISCAYNIGVLRYVNEMFCLNINFRGLRFSDFIDVEGLHIRIDIIGLIDILEDRSNACINNVGEFLYYYYEAFDRGISPLHVCCGHDVTNIIAMVYSQRSVCNERNMSIKNVEQSLRLSYERRYFQNTELFNDIRYFLDGNIIY